MTPSTRGAGCGPVRRSGGAAVKAVPGSPGPAGGHGREHGRRAGRTYDGPGGAGDAPRQAPSAADPTDVAGRLTGDLSASGTEAEINEGVGGPARGRSQLLQRHRPAHAFWAEPPGARSASVAPPPMWPRLLWWALSPDVCHS